MNKLISLKSLAVMAVCVMGAFFAASCSSDEFYGIEEDADAVVFSTLTKIANSAEYLEYQKQAFLAQQAIAGIDTTKMVKVGEIDGEPIFATESVSIQEALDARQKLVEAYPEFEKTTDAEKNQILNIAMMNNKSLRSIAPTSAINMTKGSYFETLASAYTLSSFETYAMGYTVYGGYNLGFADWYPEDNFYNAIARAVNESESSRALACGYIFDDHSGIFIDDWRNNQHIANFGTDIYYYNTTITPQCPFIAASTVNLFGAAQECARSARGWASCFAFIAEGHMEYFTR